MGAVVYGMNVSLDGYVEDAAGSIAFSEPDAEVHRLANQQAREASAFLFGRRLYDVMEGYWTAAAGQDGLPEVEAEFAAAYVETPRYVFSDTLTDVPDGVTLVRRADAAATVSRLRTLLPGPLSVGGPGLAASLADLVDEVRLFVLPLTLGAGRSFWPAGVRWDLRVVEHRVFDSGTVLLRYERFSPTCWDRDRD